MARPSSAAGLLPAGGWQRILLVRCGCPRGWRGGLEWDASVRHLGDMLAHGACSSLCTVRVIKRGGLQRPSSTSTGAAMVSQHLRISLVALAPRFLPAQSALATPALATPAVPAAVSWATPPTGAGVCTTCTSQYGRNRLRVAFHSHTMSWRSTAFRAGGRPDRLRLPAPAAAAAW